MSYNEQELLSDGFDDLPEFDTMADAITALGAGKPFLYSLTNLDGATYRGLHVTPL